MKGLGKWYVEVEKQAWWRGAQHTWVNRYVMSGTDPTGGDAYTVMEALQAIEDKLMPPSAGGNGIGFVECRAYSSSGGSPIAIFPTNPSKATSTAVGFSGGTGEGTSSWAPTLETCLLIETPVIGLSSSGKPVTLKKYIRGISYGIDQDNQAAAIPGPIITAVNAYVAPWFTGLGGTSYNVQPTSALRVTAGSPTARPFLVNHQVPRGRRKSKAVVKAESGESITGLLLTIGEAAVKQGITLVGDA